MKVIWNVTENAGNARTVRGGSGEKISKRRKK